MLNFLAQLTPEMVKTSPYVLVALGAMLWIYNESSKAAKNFKGKAPTPPNEHLQLTQDNLARRVDTVEKDLDKIEESMVGQEWFNRIDADISELKADAKKDRSGTEQHISARSATIYRKIDEVSVELRKDMSEQSDRRDKQIESLREEINKLPERLLNMLDKIKKLGGES